VRDKISQKVPINHRHTLMTKKHFCSIDSALDLIFDDVLIAVKNEEVPELASYLSGQQGTQNSLTINKNAQLIEDDTEDASELIQNSFEETTSNVFEHETSYDSHFSKNEEIPLDNLDDLNLQLEQN